MNNFLYKSDLSRTDSTLKSAGLLFIKLLTRTSWRGNDLHITAPLYRESAGGFPYSANNRDLFWFLCCLATWTSLWTNRLFPDYLRHHDAHMARAMLPQIARFIWPTWGPPGSCRPQMGPMLAPWTLPSRSPTERGRFKKALTGC